MRALLGTLDNSSRAVSYMMGALAVALAVAVLMSSTSVTDIANWAREVLGNIRRSIDYAEYGGALLLGVNGIVVKAHGRSDEQAIANAIDLERIANHRGSSFGRFTVPQPSQINFENNLAWSLTQHAASGHQHLILEDEGRNIGDRYLPRALVEYYRQAGLVVLERTLEERIQITFDEYITREQDDYKKMYGEEQGPQAWLDSMNNNMDRIRKRLGGQRYKEIKQLLLTAHESDDPEQHKAWIKPLLSDYYDPMYDYQIQNKDAEIVFKGNASDVLDYLKDLP